MFKTHNILKYKYLISFNTLQLMHWIFYNLSYKQSSNLILFYLYIMLSFIYLCVIIFVKTQIITLFVIFVY